jgi:hypothetical protein
MTRLLHRDPDDSAFARKRQWAALQMVTGSRAAVTMVAENHAGLPLR